MLEVFVSLGKILQPPRLQDDKGFYFVTIPKHIVILNEVKDLVTRP